MPRPQPGTRFRVSIDECPTHQSAYGDRLRLVQGLEVEVISDEDALPTEPPDRVHTIPVLWAYRQIPPLPWSGGWFAAAELMPL